MALLNLEDYGFDNSIEIGGDHRKLLFREGTPLVFLFDERHKEPSIATSVKIAQLLIENTIIDMIGLEHYAVGEASEGTAIGNTPEFFNGMADSGVVIVGVDNGTIFDEIVEDIDSQYWAGDSGDHPRQADRTKHMIRSLLEQHRDRGLERAVILNAGRKHIDRIWYWIKTNQIDDIAGRPASYIRVRPSDFGSSLPDPALAIPRE